MNTIDCACVIHGNLYNWDYVEKLYHSLTRHLTPQVRFHVFTEAHRSVPLPMIHHALQEWPGIHGPKKSWWYKIQLFDNAQYSGRLLYFDLDTVIVGNLDWIWQLPTDRFWAVKDFRYLFRPRHVTFNSSVMWCDTAQWRNIYDDFDHTTITETRRWHGDQDYIDSKVSLSRRGYFSSDYVKSWRWQLREGGFNFTTRKYNQPGAETVVPDCASVVVFHGDPKPHQIQDTQVLRHWY